MATASPTPHSTLAERWFPTIKSAIGFTGGTLAVLLVAYTLVHVFRTPPELPGQGPDAVLIDEVTFASQLNIGKLANAYPEATLGDMQATLEAMGKRYAGQASAWRDTALAEIKRTLDRRFVSTQERAWEHPLRGPFSVRDARLQAVRDWVADHVDALWDARRHTLDSVVRQLDGRIAEEQRQRDLMKQVIGAYEPPLSFRFLYHRGAGWTMEVSFWALIGLCANTLIALINAKKAGVYNPCHYFLFLPKFVLAPVLAVVFVALWASGLSGAEVTVLNLPWFLVFAFLLGFATETLYDKLRTMTKAFLGPTTEYRAPAPGEGTKAKSFTRFVLLDWTTWPKARRVDEVGQKFQARLVAAASGVLLENAETKER